MRQVACLLLCVVVASAQDAAPLGSEAWRGELRARVARCIDDLSAEDFQRREAASRSLLAFADVFHEDFEAARAKSQDAEARGRLSDLLDARAQVHKLVVETLLPKERFGHGAAPPSSTPSEWAEALLTHRFVLRGLGWGEVSEADLVPIVNAAQPDLARDVLVLRLEDPSSPVRAGACWMLGKLGGVEAAPLLRARLADQDRRVAGAALEALFLIADPRMAGLLLDDAVFAGLPEGERQGVPGLLNGWFLRLYQKKGLATLVSVLRGRQEIGWDVGRLIQEQLEKGPTEADLAACEELIDGDFPRSLQAFAANLLARGQKGGPRERLRAAMAHRCPEVRSAGLSRAVTECDLPDEELITAARAQLDDPDPQVRRGALYCSLHLGDVDVLRRELERADPTDKGALDSTISLVVERDRTHRFAVQLLERLQASNADQLWSWFRSSSYSKAAEYWKGDDRIDELLWRRLVKESEPARTRDYLDAAKQVLAPGSLAHAVELLDVPDAVTHFEAVSLICRLEPRPAPPELERYLDSRPVSFLEVLAHGGYEAAIRERIPVWLGDDDRRWDALRAIELLHAADWAPELRRILAEDDPHWRLELVLTLAALGDRESLPAMLETYERWTSPYSSDQRIYALPCAAFRMGGQAEVLRWLDELSRTDQTTKREAIAGLCALLGKEGLERFHDLLGEDTSELLLARLDPGCPESCQEIVAESWPLSARKASERVWLAVARAGDPQLYARILEDARSSQSMPANELFRVITAWVGQDGLGDAIEVLKTDPKELGGAFREAFRESEEPRLDDAMRFLWEALPGEERLHVMSWLSGRTSITPERWALYRELEASCSKEHRCWLRGVARAWRARQ